MSNDTELIVPPEKDTEEKDTAKSSSESSTGQCSDAAYTTADTLWAMFILFPMMVSYWRGAWSLLDYYFVGVFANNITQHAYTSPEGTSDSASDSPFLLGVPGCYVLLMGIGYLYIFTICVMPHIKRSLEDAGTVRFVICTRLLLMYQGFIYMFMWRGTWGFLDYELGDSLASSALCLILSLLFLALMGCLRTAFWPPFYIEMDSRPGLLTPKTRFNTDPKDTLKYISDCTLSGVIILCAPMLAWRSAFHIMDVKVFPEDPFKSDWVCFVVGFGGTSLLFLCQNLLGRISASLDRQGHHTYKVIYEDAVYFLAFFFMTPLWRGLWNLNVHFLITDDFVGGWVHHIIGTIGLLVTQTYSYVGAWNVILDGHNEGGGAFFPLIYFRKLRDRTFSVREMNTISGGENYSSLSSANLMENEAPLAREAPKRQNGHASKNGSPADYGTLN